MSKRKVNEDSMEDIEHENERILSGRGVSSSGSRIRVQIVTPGEIIAQNASNVLCGHGTFRDEQDRLLSSVCGIVERVNKLVSVRPLRARYPGEVGDTIVGRITEITGKSWRVDIQARRDAILPLSAVNLPGGEQRRKTNEDQLNMRSLFAENDIIVAEVASHGHNGALQLQTRSSNYGRLDSGVFVRVYAALVKRSQQHFVSFDFGVQVILANNGYIWIKKLSEEDQKKQKHLPFMSKTQVGRKEESVSGKDRENICRVRNAILALQAMFIPIHQKTILDVLESSKEMEAKAMTIPDQIPIITASAQLRVQKQMLEEEMDTTSLY